MKHMGLLAVAALVGLPALAQTPASSAQPQASTPTPKAHGRNRSGVYIQGGIEGLAIDDETSFFDNPAFGTIQARLGYSIAPWIAVEGQAALGVSAFVFDDDGEMYEDDDLSLNSSYGAFVVPRIPLGDHFGIYGRAGYMWTEYENDTGFSTTSTKTHGPAYGVGFDADFGPASIAFDFTFSTLQSKDTTGSFTTGSYDASGVSFTVLGGFHF